MSHSTTRPTLDDPAIRIPARAATLAGFRAWALSDEFPERGRFSFINGELFIDMSPEELETHNKVKTEVVFAIANLNTELDHHSSLKAKLDAASRLQRIERALVRLGELQQKLASPRTRYRERAKVSEAVEAVLRECEVAGWITVEVSNRTAATYRQERRGRPGEKTRWV